MISKSEGKYRKGYGCVFGASMPRQVVTEIDKIRGDIPRSRWLRRAATNELERQRKEKEKPLLQQGLNSVGTHSSPVVATAPEVVPIKGGYDPND